MFTAVLEKEYKTSWRYREQSQERKMGIKIKNGSLYQLGLLMFQIKNLNCLKQWENLLTYKTEQSRGSAGFKIGLI